MQITFTDEAKEILNRIIGDQNGFLKIRYETEGCGCSSGVPTLWFVASQNVDEDILLNTNFGQILMEKTKLLYFDEELKIDYSPSVQSFQLKSPQQILNGRMSFISKIEDFNVKSFAQRENSK